MCSCYVEAFHQGNEYVQKLCHFYCHCKAKHAYYIHICRGWIKNALVNLKDPIFLIFVPIKFACEKYIKIFKII